jgi:uncharacterized membrane protein YhaH (DUF805 family)
MSFLDSVRTCLRKYGDFSGRARPSEYWFWYLAVSAAYVVVFVAFMIPALITMDPVTVAPGVLGTIGMILWTILALGTVVPMISAAVRRLHDTGKSGWFFLLTFIPFAGVIIGIVLLAAGGEPGPNRFGARAARDRVLTDTLGAGGPCLPDGSSRLRTDPYDPWALLPVFNLVRGSTSRDTMCALVGDFRHIT